MPLHRRQVLASVGSALVATGCLGAASPGSEDSPAQSPDGSPTNSPSPTPGDEPSPTPVGPADEFPDRIADEACPSFSEDVDRTACDHTRSPDAEVYLTASPVVYQPVEGGEDVKRVYFTLHNDSGQSAGFNPYGWAVKARTEDGWDHVAPEVYPEPWTSIPPGETYDWGLSRQEHPTPYTDNAKFPVVEVDSGLHAFTVTVHVGEEDPTTVECVALFDVAVNVRN